MSITYFYRNTTSDLTGSPSTIGNFDLLQETGASSSQINTGNLAPAATASCWFFTPSGDPGTDGTSTGDFTLELRIDIQNANIGIRCYLQRYNSGGTAQGSLVEATEGSQTAGAATRQYNWTDPNLSTWAAGDRLGVRVQFTNISELMNQSCRLGANLDTDTLITPFTAAAGEHDAFAELASGAGIANNAAIAQPDEFAWNNPTPWDNAETWYTDSGGIDANAETAAGTGAANNATVSISGATTANAGNATGTGAAQDITARLSPTPATATATGVASNATVQTTGGTTANAGLATGTGTANNPTTTVATTPPDFFSEIYGDVYGSPVGIGAAQNITANISPTQATATATGTANNATVQTGSFVNAQAGVATATVTTNNAAVTVSGATTANAGLAEGTGSAANTAHSVFTAAGAASAVGQALQASTGIAGPVLVDLNFIPLAPELTHGPALGPELVVRVALAPGLAHGAAGAPETATRDVGVPALTHGEPGAPETTHGQPEHDLVHGDAGEPTV